MLKVIAEGVGASVSKRYYDLVKKRSKTEEKSADEIALSIIERAGLQVKQ